MNPEKYRKDFPLLVRGFEGKPVVYFDNACVTLKPRQVIEAMNRYYEEFPACHGRSYHKLGMKVTEEYEKARETLKKFVGAKRSGEIIFLRNTTEAINLVANSIGLKKGDVVLTSDKEHNSNLVPWLFLEKKAGIKHEVVKTGEEGILEPEALQEAINRKVKLVSLVHTSNLDGTTFPIKELAAVCRDHGIPILVDGAQSVPHKEVKVDRLGVDFLAFSGHKMLGPSGIGCLYGRYELLERMEPFLTGGDTVEDTTYTSCRLSKPPEKFEAGLQNYAGAIGLAEAARYVERVGRENIEKHEVKLNRLITEGISGIAEILGPGPEKRGGIVSFTVPGIHPHDISAFMDMHNIFIRSGAHCVHSWFNARGLEGSARASLYLYNTKEEAEKFVEVLKKTVETFG